MPTPLPAYTDAPPMETRAAIPLWHAAAGIGWLLTAGGLLLWGSADLAAGAWGSPRLVGATHALTLGWLLTVTVGVLHQIGPAAMGVTPRSGRAWRALLPLLTLGVAAVVVGAVTGHPSALRGGWSAVVLATLAYGYVLLGPWRASPAGRTTARRVALVFAALGLTFALALVRLLYGTLGITPDLTALRLGHVAAGLGGFGTLLGVAIGGQLFPGFFGARDTSVAWSTAAYRALLTGVTLVVLTSIVPMGAPTWVELLRRTGLVVAAVGGALFTAQVWRWRAARRVATLDPTLRGAVAASVALGTASALAIVATVSATPSAAVLTLWGVLMLPGWISLLIAGVLLRVLPLMAWMERYGRADPVVKRSVKVAQLVRMREAHWVIHGLAVGVALIAGGIVVSMASIVRVGAVSFLLASALLAAQLLAAWQAPPRAE